MILFFRFNGCFMTVILLNSKTVNIKNEQKKKYTNVYCFGCINHKYFFLVYQKKCCFKFIKTCCFEGLLLVFVIGSLLNCLRKYKNLKLQLVKISRCCSQTN